MTKSISAPALLASAVLVAGMLAACQKSTTEESASVAAGPPGDPVHGKQIFVTLCSTCHGPDGNGVKGLGKSLVESEYVKKTSDADLAKMVAEGRAASHPLNTTKVAMPPRGGNPALSDQDIRDAVSYVRSINKVS